MTNDAKKLELKDEFAGVVLEKSEDGRRLVVDLSALSGVDVTVKTSGGTVQLKAPAPEQNNGATATVTKKAYRIGDVLPDGWVVGPRSPKTGIVMAIEPVSGALDGYKTWYQGEDHAEELRKQGHANARQPSADTYNDELTAIFYEVVKAGRNGNAQFNTSDPDSDHWSGTGYHSDNYRWNLGWPQRDQKQAYAFCFSGGGNSSIHYRRSPIAYVRCVRDEPDITLA